MEQIEMMAHVHAAVVSGTRSLVLTCTIVMGNPLKIPGKSDIKLYFRQATGVLEPVSVRVKEYGKD